MEGREACACRATAGVSLACLLWVAAVAHGAGLAGGVRLAMLPQSWLDDSGQPASLTAFAGQHVVLTMAYANCRRICPMTIEGLKHLQSALDANGERAEFVIVGSDPANETAATWRHYRSSHHLDRPNWHFFTGTVADTTQLARQLHFELWKYDEHVMHESRVLLFDGNGLLARERSSEIEELSSAF